MALSRATGSSAYRLPTADSATHLDEPLRKIGMAIRPEWEWVFELRQAERRVPVHVGGQGRVQLEVRRRTTRVRVHRSRLGKAGGRTSRVLCII